MYVLLKSKFNPESIELITCKEIHFLARPLTATKKYVHMMCYTDRMHDVDFSATFNLAQTFTQLRQFLRRNFIKHTIDELRDTEIHVAW